ncbi:MAG: (d)CMP kinase [Myxococcota bacterium]
MREITIAIDGPASSGKGTVARAVAEQLGYAYVDTGAMYRAVGLTALRRGVDPRDPVATEAIALALHFAFDWHKGSLRVIVDGEDVSKAIRTEPVGNAASAVAVHPGVRAALLQTQRDLGAGGGVVMDGRDIGTVVLPGAELKVFLDASLEERARRRHLESPGTAYDVVLRELAARDAQDAGRATAPLRKADDAVAIDTTGLSVPEVVSAVLRLADARRAR